MGSVTKEPSNKDSDCPEFMCITRIWKKGIDGARTFLSKEVSDMEIGDNESNLLHEYDSTYDDDEDDEDFDYTLSSEDGE